MDPNVKATALTLSHIIQKIKDSCGQNQRYTLKIDSKTKKTSKQLTVCLKICVGLGEKK